jgi:hypothetical protein
VHYRFLPLLFSSVLMAAPAYKVAAFRADATPDMGEPNIWVEPVTAVMDPLFAKGIVIEAGGERYVIAAIDWCGIGGSTHLMLRSRIAGAAHTAVNHVALQSVHQHSAPYVDGDAYGLLSKARIPLLEMSDTFLDKLARRLEAAVGEAVARLEPFDRVGTGKARVERVASARRIAKDGRILTRFSSTARTPELAAEPEGAIDDEVRTVTLARGAKPLVRLHYYATHPQTFCCDGRVSADFVGAAREREEKDEGIPQVYFTACAGDVTVGKYNTGKDAEREQLAERLYAALKASAASTTYQPVSTIEWKYADLRLEPRTDGADYRAAKPGQAAYRAALRAAFAARTRALPTSALHLGNLVMVYLPGEPLLEFQRFAQQTASGKFVTVAGYGDMAPGYLCPDEAVRQGGYEPSASNAAPGSEGRIKDVIRNLLGL